jgi:hypothetical protein
MSEALRFECTQCGECCTSRGEYGYVYVNDREVAAIAKHLQMTPHELRRRYTFVDEYGWTQVVLQERCVFLEEGTNRCTIYPARPVQCRTFPFWRDLVRDGEWTDEARGLCEGVGAGRLYQIEEIEPLMRDMDRAQQE